MPPTLPTSSTRASSYFSDLKTLVNPLQSPPNRSRGDLLRSILARSVRIRITNEPNGVKLPLKIRPALVVLNVLDLLLLGLLGFHPKASHLPISDKLLHFLCFFIATLLFFCIWDVDTALLRSTPSRFWHRLPLLLTFFTCFLVGGVGSEFVQSLLPYKIFDWGDILANLAGCSLGLFTSWHVEQRIREKRELRRLYTPLDFDDDGAAGVYDVDDDDDGSGGDDIEARPHSSRNTNTSVFDDDGDERGRIAGTPTQPSTAPSPSRNPSSKPPATSPSPRDLFSIDDDDGDEQEEERNVWRDTT